MIREETMGPPGPFRRVAQSEAAARAPNILLAKAIPRPPTMAHTVRLCGPARCGLLDG